MRIVFDTNVLIAAFITRGASAEVFEYCLFRHTLILSSFILQEMEEKLTGKFQFSTAYVKEILKLLQETAEMVTPIPLTEPVCRDATDDWILATALTAQAEIIVTGDGDLLEMNNFRGIAIIKPAGFWRYESSH